MSSSKQKLLALSYRSQQTSGALEKACDSLKHLEEELESFLAEYYEAVEAQIRELETLQQSLHHTSNACFQLPPTPTVQTSEDPLPKAIAKDSKPIKQLYYEMAKECHPDRLAQENGDHSAISALKADIMKTLNYAYARRNLAEMWEIKWELERHKHGGKLNHKQRLQLLERQHEQMSKALESVQLREEAIKESPAYALYQQSKAFRACGFDFITTVQSHLQQQIDQTKLQLVSAKMQKRYWSHVTMKPAANAA